MIVLLLNFRVLFHIIRIRICLPRVNLRLRQIFVRVKTFKHLSVTMRTNRVVMNSLFGGRGISCDVFRGRCVSDVSRRVFGSDCCTDDKCLINDLDSSFTGRWDLQFWRQFAVFKYSILGPIKITLCLIHARARAYGGCRLEVQCITETFGVYFWRHTRQWIFKMPFQVRTLPTLASPYAMHRTQVTALMSSPSIILVTILTNALVVSEYNFFLRIKVHICSVSVSYHILQTFLR